MHSRSCESCLTTRSRKAKSSIPYCVVKCIGNSFAQFWKIIGSKSEGGEITSGQNYGKRYIDLRRAQHRPLFRSNDPQPITPAHLMLGRPLEPITKPTYETITTTGSVAEPFLEKVVSRVPVNTSIKSEVDEETA